MSPSVGFRSCKMCIFAERKHLAMKYFFLILSFCLCVTYGRAVSVEATDIPSLHRLPVNAIHRIYQDREGYIWYGTVNGLCRDDGYQVQTFRSDFNHRGLMANNLVECITEDGDGCIWFGTDKGAYRMSKRDYRVVSVEHPLLDGKIIRQMYRTKDGSVWISIMGSLLRYHGHRLVKVYPTLNGRVPTYVYGFCEGRGGEIIVLYSSGLIYHLDTARDEFVPYPDGGLRHNFSAIVQDAEQDYYWLATWGSGIYRFSPSAAPDSMFVRQHTEGSAVGDSPVLYMVRDDRHKKIWTTTLAGLQAYDCTDGKLYPCQPDTKRPLTHVMLNDMIQDRRGDLWVSAFDTPSFILHSDMDAPEWISLASLQKTGYFRPAVMALHDDGDGRFWMFLERNGLFLFDPTTGHMSGHREFPSVSSLPFYLVKLMEGSCMPHAVWVVSDFSLKAYRLVHDGMRMRLSDVVDLTPYPSQGYITTLHESADGKKLWLGTDRGILCYDLREKAVERCYAIGHVTAFSTSSSGRLWIATNNRGLYSLGGNGVWHRYHFRQALSSLALAADGTLWMGSEEGDLLSFVPESRTVRSYNQACRLEGDAVNRVVTDEFGHVWVGMNNMVMELNPKNGSYREYLTSDGSMGLWRVIPTALCVAHDGRICFGGISGICRFTPSNALDRAAEPARVVVTDIHADRRSLFFGNKERVCRVDSVIDIRPEVGRLDISFSSLNHRLAHKIRYAYRLEGVDDNWQYTGEGQNTAVYSRLPKGEYIFEVKSTDDNGQWSHEVTKVKFHCLPAWYETSWAYVLYVLMSFAGLGWAAYAYSRRLKRKNEELWADSTELVKMRDYLNQTSHGEDETEKLDRLLTEKAVKVVEAHLREPDFDVQKLAEGMNMSRSTLSRKLKAATGDTPLDFIRRIKMKHACRMLEDPGRNVSEVAADLGFQNRKYFTACFKEEFGMTPSEYQKSVGKEGEG